MTSALYVQSYAFNLSRRVSFQRTTRMSDVKQKTSCLWTSFLVKYIMGPFLHSDIRKELSKPSCALPQTLFGGDFFLPWGNTFLPKGNTFMSCVYLHASINLLYFHKRKKWCRTPADDTWTGWLTCCHGHYSLLVCCLKMNGHSGIILILLLFSGGRSNSEVSKEVNQPSQSGNSTESWESCFFFIKDTTCYNSNRDA